MKSKSLLGATVALVILFSSCDTERIKASSEITTVEYSFSDYNTLHVSDDFEVYVTFSDTREHIELEVNENLKNKIEVSKSGNTLRIGLENNVSVRGNVTLKAYITTSEISSYDINGDSIVELESPLLAENVSIDVSGDSFFTGNLDVNSLRVDVRGDSVVDVYGLASVVNADLRGDSIFKDYDLESEVLNIDLSGDSVAYLFVSESIDIEASGDSVLNYKGDAEIIRQRLSGDSKIRKRD